MAKGLRAALTKAGLSADDLRLILAHQSNHRVLADLAAEMGVPADIMASNLRLRGNTSSSALPLLLHDIRTAGPVVPVGTDRNAYSTATNGVSEALLPGSYLGFTAFGGGFTYGGAIGQVL